MRIVCAVLVWGFAGAYLLAVGLLALAAVGVFGAERDPLAGVVLMPLGLPWTLMLGGLPESVRPWLAVGVPLANLVLLDALCRLGRDHR